MQYQYEDADPAFWLREVETRERMAEIIAQHRDMLREHPLDIMRSRIEQSRITLGAFLTGLGAEVGAGSRPFPTPASVQVLYGDIRDEAALENYFGKGLPHAVRAGQFLDAQRFGNIANDTFDFVISAHVIEHLFDPIGAIEHTIRVIRPGGLFVLVVPDMRHTFDRNRPETSLAHVVADHADGGEGTRRQAFEEHLRHIMPLEGAVLSEDEIAQHAEINMASKMDVHVHAWTPGGFREMLAYCETIFPICVEAAIEVGNEYQLLVRKTSLPDRTKG